MSSPRTAPPPGTDDAPPPRSPGLSAVQVAAGALAAVSSAVLLSFFGVAGTVIGAALASVVSTVGASLYSTSLNRTNERLRRALTRERAAGGSAPRALPAHLDPRRAPAPRIRPRWGRLAGYGVAVFVVGMAVVTGIELIGQQPVSALVGHGQPSGTTTLGALANTSTSTGSTPATPSAPSTAPASPSTSGTPSSSAPSTPTSAPDLPAEDTASDASSSPAGPSSPSTGASPAAESSSSPTTSESAESTVP